jgi:hypothetical protein
MASLLAKSWLGARRQILQGAGHELPAAVLPEMIESIMGCISGRLTRFPPKWERNLRKDE